MAQEPAAGRHTLPIQNPEHRVLVISPEERLRVAMARQ